MMRSLALAAVVSLLLPPVLRADTAGQPAWAAEAIFYQIFPERFCNGDANDDPTRDSLETPVHPGSSWRVSSWTADWYSRDEWEKELGKDFYEDGVFDRRYGGDLKGVLDKLDYLKDLGVNALYFNPLFYSRSLHKYDGNSYHHIDPFFGPDPAGDMATMEQETADPKSWQWTKADKLFLEVVKQAHVRGMRVIIDGVFNHTGRDFFAFRDIRKNQAQSPYKDWFVVTSFDDPNTKRDEFDYKGWWGHKTLPIFAASSDGKDMHPGPKAYVFEATKRWMQPDGKQENGIDGWRLDVADERPFKFWADWNALVRQLNPNAYTTAEIWKPATELVKQGGFSAAMNYSAFAIPVKGFLIDNHVVPSKFADIIEKRRKDFPPATAAVMQNLEGSHDTDRLASMIVNGEKTPYANPNEIDFNKDSSPRSSKIYDIRKPNERERDIQRLVVLWQMVYVGAPMIYYGDEAGMWGSNDPDDRMPMIWADKTYEPQAIDPRGKERKPDEVKFDENLFGFYKKAIALRREHDSLNHGDFAVLKTDDAQRVIAVTRKSAKETLAVAINRGDKEAQLELALPAKSTVLFVTKGEPSAVKLVSSPAGVTLTIPALTGVVLQVP